MQWTEVSLQTTHEQADTIADILYSAGAQGVAMEDPLLINQLRASGTWELCDIPEQQNTEVVTVTAYYPDDEKLSERLEFISREVKAVEERIGQKCVFRNPLFRTLCEQDWANEWKQYFHVTHIGKHLVIKPSWEKYDAKADDLVIEIDPGMAFGTGTHHTTSMCMEYLEEIITPQAEVFDVGTGSGILSIAAAKLGAKSIVAVDIDANAVRIAKGTMRLTPSSTAFWMIKSIFSPFTSPCASVIFTAGSWLSAITSRHFTSVCPGAVSVISARAVTPSSLTICTFSPGFILSTV